LKLVPATAAHAGVALRAGAAGAACSLTNRNMDDKHGRARKIVRTKVSNNFIAHGKLEGGTTY